MSRTPAVRFRARFACCSVEFHRANFVRDVPPVEMRVQTKFKPRDTEDGAGIPAYAGDPPKFMMKLVAARVAMLFHR